VAVDVEVGDIAVEALADEVSHPADGEDVAGAVEGDAVVEGEALAALDLGGDGLKGRIVGLKGVAGTRVWTRQRDRSGFHTPLF
jgi:hypothetical protein